ncbi:MAG: C10 family peptidase [Bacteroidales bacterium]|nr:C10 family peptidase [Bacteroidales bacterium]
MNTRFYALAAALLLAAATQAAPVGADAARKAATRFWNSHRPADVKPDPQWTQVGWAEFPHLYIFAGQGTGFVVVAGDDCVQPVLAYAFDAPLPEAPHPGLRHWLNGYEVQIAEAVAAGYTPSAAVEEQWEQVTGEADEADTLILVAPMLTTRWDQGAPFNNLCPYDTPQRQRTVVGCAATAMAQVMKYWNYPAYGTGSHSYEHSSYGTLSADFAGTTYHWDLMVDDATMFPSTAQRNALATLSYHCGVAIEMDYGLSSGAWVLSFSSYTPCVHNALVNNFKYSEELTSRARHYVSDDDWFSFVDAEMEARRPMVYVGYDESGGHAFVLDGADSQKRYHFNWGWSGYGDGFYALNNLAPGNTGGAGGNATYTFNQDQGALFNIKPAMEEHFDTVVYYDTICAPTNTATFYDYTLRAEDSDTLLHHLDTVFHYFLARINAKRVRFDPNGGNGMAEFYITCPINGLTFPDYGFTREGYRFAGWCSDRDGLDSVYHPGEFLRYNLASRYYAVWEDALAINTDAAPDGTLDLGPLPAADLLNVSFRSSSQADIVILDALGRPCLRAQLRDGQAKIPVATLPSGVYILQLKDGNSIYNRRIIKQ